MDESKCYKCNKSIEKAIVLVCDHTLCLSCAEDIKKPEGTPPLDQKFRLVCPMCDKNTITINIENLINSSKDQFLFENMESSELNESALGQIIANDPQKPGFTQRQLKQMSYSQRFSNIWVQRKTPDITERTSKASNDSKRNNKGGKNRSGAENSFNTQCHMHKENLIFFCEQQKRVMCMQCIYQHTKKHKNHQICQIKDALLIIESQNKSFKTEAKKKIEEIDKFLVISRSNKGQIEKAYQIHQQLIDKQFKQLQFLIKSKKNETLEYLEKIFTKKQRETASQISDFNYLKKCLQEYQDYPLQNEQSQLYFYNAYSIMRDAIHKGTTKIRKFQKEDLACFDKFCSTSDFKSLLDKFLKPKKDGKESKAQSRGNSQTGNQKPKSILYDEYKTAKKNLDKINKLQKEHKINKEKNFNYLNNYVIDIQKKQIGEHNHEKGAISTVRQRKSSMGGYNQSEDKKNYHHKALTPTRLMNGSKKKK